jgi:hypothetical protein
LHNEELHNFFLPKYYECGQIHGDGWDNAAGVGYMRDVYKILAGKSEGKRQR